MFNWFYNLKIRYKLLGSFLFITLLTIILGIFTWIGQTQAKSAVDEFINTNSKLVELSYITENDMLLARQAENNYLLNYRQLGFTQAEETYLVTIKNKVAAIHQNMEEMRTLSPDDATLVDATQQIDQAIDEYQTTFLATVTGLQQQGYANAGLEGEFTRKIKQVQGVVRSLQNDKLLIDVLSMQLEEKDYIHLRDEKFVTALDNANKKFIADVNKTELYDSDKKGLETLVTQYQDLFSQVLAIDADVATKQEQYQTAVEKLSPLLDGIRTQLAASQAETVANVNHTTRTAQTVTLILSIAVAIIGISVGLFLSQTISRALETVSGAATGLASGNLNQHITAQGSDELGLMAKAFSGMIDYFREMATVAEQLASGDLTATVVPLSDEDVLGNTFANMIHTLRELVKEVTQNAASVTQSAQQLTEVSENAGQSAEHVAETVVQVAHRTVEQSEHIEQAKMTVQQVSHAVTGVAHGAQEQAGAVGQSMTQVEHISSVVEQVADNAQSSAQQAAQAATIAQEGVAVVEKTIAGMTVIRGKVGMSAQRVEEMGERSQRIEAIVETIDDIAAQTNLLALNAAIEAARAGEHGKGFAVVADEVRKLAEKSAQATREIGALIKGIQHTVEEAVTAMTDSTVEVENGVTLAEKSGEALNHILQAVSTVEEQVISIAGASQEMNATSSAMVHSMESVSAVVEENTASTEEMAASITEVTDAINDIAEISQATNTSVNNVSNRAVDMRNQVQQATVAAHDLNQLANDLMAAMARFKTTADIEPDTNIEPEISPTDMPETEVLELEIMVQ